MNRKHLGKINRLANLHSDRMPGNGSIATFVQSGDQSSAKRDIERRARMHMGDAEYERRQAEAREVKHCVMNLPKSNYIVVTDKEMIKLMGKKVV